MNGTNVSIDDVGSSLTPGARRMLMSLGIIVIVGAIVVGSLFASGVIKLNKDAGPQSCVDDKNCKAGQECGDVNGKKECVTVCESNENCNEGLQCYDGVCSEIKDECTVDSECPEAQACGTVIPDAGSQYRKCSPVTCNDASNAGCGAGFECVGGKCQAVPNETCLQGKPCPPEQPLCLPSFEDASVGVCVPAPQPECISDECTKKGPKFFCNAFDVCVEAAGTPTVTPAAARDSTTGLSTAQIVFLVLASFAGIFCAVEFYRVGRRTYRKTGVSPGFSPRQRERNSGEVVAAVLCLMASVISFMVIGFDASDNFLIIPGMFLVAAVGLLVYFKIEESRTPYTKQEVQTKGADLAEQSYEALNRDLDVLDAIAADPDIPEIVKQDLMAQIGKNLAYSSIVANVTGNFENNLERLRLDRELIVAAVKQEEGLEDNDQKLVELNEKLSQSTAEGFKEGQKEYFEDLNYRTRDTAEARKEIEKIKAEQEAITLWDDNNDAIQTRNKMSKLLFQMNNEEGGNKKNRNIYEGLENQLNQQLERQRQERGKIFKKQEKQIENIVKNSAKAPTLVQTSDLKQVFKDRRRGFETFSGSGRELDKQLRDAKKELKTLKSEGLPTQIVAAQANVDKIKAEKKDRREIKKTRKLKKKKRAKALDKQKRNAMMKFGREKVSQQEQQERGRQSSFDI